MTWTQSGGARSTSRLGLNQTPAHPGGGGVPLLPGTHQSANGEGSCPGVVKQRILSYHMTPVTQAIRSSLFQVQC